MTDSPAKDPTCVERWPECEEDAFHPRCCRFPKSCSPLLAEEEPAPEETVEVPVFLLERLRGVLRHGNDVPLFEALLDCLPDSRSKKKIEKMAEAIHSADRSAGLNGLEWAEMNARARKRYILRATAAYEAMGEDA